MLRISLIVYLVRTLTNIQTFSSDAYYFYSLEKDLFGINRLSLTNPGWQVVTAMAVFVFMALVKDITCCLWSISSCDFYHKKFSMSASQNMRLKTIKLVLNLLLEDVCQITTQYFYFEKVLLQKSNFVYINAVIVFISGAFNLKVLKLFLNLLIVLQDRCSGLFFSQKRRHKHNRQNSRWIVFDAVGKSDSATNWSNQSNKSTKFTHTRSMHWL